ncbi:MAG: 7TM diverse intracellular signaling domain-containing protein [Spirosomataceae bacterium]
MRRTFAILTVITIALSAGLLGWVSNTAKQYLPIEISLFEDKTNTLLVNQAAEYREAGLFKANPNRRLSVGYTEAVYWAHFRLSADVTPADLSLEITNSKINALELFELKDNTFVSLGKTGDFLPFSQRPSPTHTFVYHLHLNSYQSVKYFLKLDKRYEDLATEIRLWRTTDFEQADQSNYLNWGIFTGFVLLISVLNLLMGFVTRDKTYAWYVAYILTFAFRQYTDVGLSFEFLWPNAPLLNRPDPLLMSVWLYVFVFLSFILSFVKSTPITNTLSFRLINRYRWVPMSFLGIVGVLMLLGIPSTYPGIYMIIYRVYSIGSIPVFVLIFWSAWVSLRLKNTITAYYSFAILIQVLMQIINVIQIITRNQANGIYWIEGYLTLMVGFVMDLVVFSLGLAYRYNQFKKETEKLENEYLEVKQEQNANLIDALAHERLRITQQLNEEVGALLASASFTIAKALQQTKFQEQTPLLSSASKLIDKSVDDLRNITLNLVPVEFAEQGLAVSLQNAVQNASRPDEVTFQFKCTGAPVALAVSVEVQLYRIATELINNILKHSEATQATVALHYLIDQVQLEVQDNGKGFDVQQLEQGKGGIGVNNLHSRAQYLHAELSMQSDEKGTIVKVCVPISEVENG